ncbi:MAG TPA: NAD-dependent epimerase/dehydratase family protein [Gemmatimonadales bacterium]|nr:NAD-dependent epimerase/dehydratase family protein [Gemmatimonadales bacterium]
MVRTSCRALGAAVMCGTRGRSAAPPLPYATTPHATTLEQLNGRSACMQVFLTGATGYIGSAVAAALRAVGHEVSGLARNDAAVERLERSGVRPVRGDLADTAVIEQAARAADGVIHAGSTNDARGPEVDRAAVDAIIRALDGTDKPFVYTSGIWVYGDTQGRVVDETTPLTPAPIVAWRPAVERRVLDAAAHGVRAIVLRPGIVYGQQGGIPQLFIRWAKERGAARVIGSGENRWPTVHVADLADLYVRALQRAPAGTVLIASTLPSVELRKVAAAAAEAACVGTKLETWPLEQARQELGPFADALALDQQASGDAARKLLGWTPRAPDIVEAVRSGR